MSNNTKSVDAATKARTGNIGLIVLSLLFYGRLVGIGNIIIGASFMIFSLLMALEFEIVASAVMILGLVIGLGFAFYAMIKYNKGIF